MGLSLLNLKGRPVELVFNDHSIRYLEMIHSGDPGQLKWGERHLPPGIIRDGKIADRTTLAMILEECIETWKIKRRRVRFLVPDPFVIFRKIEIPADIHEDEIEGYLYLEVGESIHLPFEDPVFDFSLLPQTGEKREILLFAAQRDPVVEYGELLESLKLKPETADVSGLALYRLFDHLSSGQGDANLLFIQYDIDLVNMSIFENGAPFYMRHHLMPFEQNHWSMQMVDADFRQYMYKGDEAELAGRLAEVAKEVGRLIDFYQYSLNKGTRELSKIVLTGDHPMLASIALDLQTRFGIQSEVMKSPLLSSENNNPLPATHHLALGLALKEV